MKSRLIVLCLLLALASLAIFGIHYEFTHASAAPDEDDQAPDVTPLVTVQAAPLRRLTLESFLEVFGTILPAPAGPGQPAADAPLAAPAAGVVARVNVVPGQEVTNGQVLVTLNGGNSTAENAAQEVARQELLYSEHDTSQKALQDARAQLALLEIKAPFDGTVVSVSAKPGAATDPASTAVEIMNLRRLAVEMQVPMDQSAPLQPGLPVRIAGKPGIQTVLWRISPAMDTNNDTVHAWALLPPETSLRPGQFVKLEIQTARHVDCLAAPAASVVTDESGHSTLSLVDGSHSRQVAVQTGLRQDDWVEVTGNDLKPGDSVVTVGAYALPDQTPIHVLDTDSNTNQTNPQTNSPTDPAP